MKDLYQQTSYYYNDIYEKQETYNPEAIVWDPTIKAALQFASKGAYLGIDIGCGSGEMAATMLHYGVKQIIGLDCSYHGISLARRSSSNYFSTLRTKWLWSGIEALRAYPDDSADSVILSRVLQELRPQEGLMALDEAMRLLKPNGRLVVILNQDLPKPISATAIELPDILEPCLDGFSDRGFELSDGRYLWRITSEEVEKYYEAECQMISKGETEFGEIVLCFIKTEGATQHA